MTYDEWNQRREQIRRTLVGGGVGSQQTDELSGRLAYEELGPRPPKPDTANEHLMRVLGSLRTDAEKLERTRWWERGYRRDAATARALRYVAAAVAESVRKGFA